ncbi:hypothetical protein Mapa_017424 [Marchantia paleacea]|nr:hypothetical protein Mapa_017424 [Marchantia paleacea]
MLVHHVPGFLSKTCLSQAGTEIVSQYRVDSLPEIEEEALVVSLFLPDLNYLGWEDVAQPFRTRLPDHHGSHNLYISEDIPGPHCLLVFASTVRR